MRVVVIGGTGHIGTFLIPRLVEGGHSVVNVSRGQRQPYRRDPAFDMVHQVVLDRATEEAAGWFGATIRKLEGDAVIDLTCYMLESAVQLVEALRGSVSHFLHCGTIWVHGVSKEVPLKEEHPREPFGDYGIRKAAIEAYLLREARLGHIPATILHPGHLVGPGWIPLNPVGNFNPAIFLDLARGNKVVLPSLGRECVHHVHADDVAQAFVQALVHWSSAVGESFHVVSPAALTLYGYAHAVAEWFGKQAELEFLPWEEWKQGVSDKDAQTTWGHIARSSNCSIDKATRLLQYRPRYRSAEAIHEAVRAMISNKVIEI